MAETTTNTPLPALGRSSDGVLFLTDTDDPAHIPHEVKVAKGTAGGTCFWKRLLAWAGGVTK